MKDSRLGAGLTDSGVIAPPTNSVETAEEEEVAKAIKESRSEKWMCNCDGC